MASCELSLASETWLVADEWASEPSWAAVDPQGTAVSTTTGSAETGSAATGSMAAESVLDSTSTTDWMEVVSASAAALAASASAAALAAASASAAALAAASASATALAAASASAAALAAASASAAALAAASAFSFFLSSRVLNCLCYNKIVSSIMDMKIGHVVEKHSAYSPSLGWCSADRDRYADNNEDDLHM